MITGIYDYHYYGARIFFLRNGQKDLRIAVRDFPETEAAFKSFTDRFICAVLVGFFYKN
ncbi:hypothetical protein BH10ACI1_BH10ACI1_15490 [soil metagenome]